MTESGVFRVFLLGASLQGGNRGVRALAESLIRLIGEARPDARVTLFAGDRVVAQPDSIVAGVPVHVLNFRSSPKAPPHQNLYWLFVAALLYRVLPLPPFRRWILRAHPPLAAIVEADFVGNIRGGDSFSDIYGLQRYLRGTVPSWIIRALGAPLVLLPQTYGPFRSGTARRIARGIMRSASRIYARDAESLALAQDLVADGGVPIELSPDVAFALEARRPPEPKISPALPERDGEVLVGLNVSGLLYMGGFNRSNMFGLQSPYDETVHQFVAALLELPGTRLLLVPHVTGEREESDVAACRAVLEWAEQHYPGRAHVVEAEYDQGEIKGVIGMCDFFLGARMHACIGAMSQGVPTVGIAYSKKFKGVFDVAGMGECVVDPRLLDSAAVTAACLSHFSRRAEIAQRLSETIPRVKQDLRRCFREMLA